MGVIKRHLFGTVHVTAIQDTASETTDTASVASAQTSAVQVPRGRRRRRVRGATATVDTYERENEERSGRIGARQARRLANVQFLMNLAERFGGSGHDEKNGPYESSSIFAELFSDGEKMLFWQEFSSLSEDRQIRLLEKFGAPTQPPVLRTISEESEDSDSAEHQRQTQSGASAVKASEASSDSESTDFGFELVAGAGAGKRTANPSARHCDCETCYARIEPRFRAMLRRRDAPRGLLDSLEQRLTAYFTESPDAVYVMSLASPYERLCAHIVAEWLGLRAQSVNGEVLSTDSPQNIIRTRRKRAERCTVVENANADFVPPEKCLVHYLDDRNLKQNGSLLED